MLREHASNAHSEIEYVTVEAATDADVFAWIARARREDYRGANVTYPYKEVVATAIARPSKLSRKIMSANTLLFASYVYSDSTDGAGFVNALRRRIADSFLGRDLIVLGAGGAARAIVSQLATLPFATITVFARDAEKARKSFRWLKDIRVSGLESLSRRATPSLVIQATPVGQQSEENLAVNFEWREDDIAADTVYRPIDTAFLRSAKSAGAQTVDGFGMLIEQAALSQMMWLTGTVPRHSPLTHTQFDSLWHRFFGQLN